jgi:hypothetical protein
VVSAPHAPADYDPTLCLVNKVKDVGGSLKPFQAVLCWPIRVWFGELLKEAQNKRIVVADVAAPTAAFASVRYWPISPP